MTSAEFKQAISEGTVLVDFWAAWCGPCEAISASLDAIAAEQGIKLVKVNVDDENDLANEYNLTSIPTMMVFRDGVLDKTVVGAYPKDLLVKRLGLA